MKIRTGTKYVLSHTEFHGGDVISYHRSLRAAVKNQKTYQSVHCVCGCAEIHSIDGEKIGCDNLEYSRLHGYIN